MIALILQSRIARMIGAAVMGALAILSFGLVKRREGVAAERAKQAQRDAQANEEAHARITEADTGAGLSDDARRDRLRQFAAKHGTGSPKAGR